MNENEIMEMNEVEVTEEPEVVEEHTGIGTGLAMLIGSGLTLAAIAAVKKGKKVWERYKAKKEVAEVTGDEAETIDIECEKSED